MSPTISVPHRQACLYRSSVLALVISVFISRWRSFLLPSKWGSGDNHSVIWGVFIGQTFVECLLFVEEMNSSQSTAPGSSCSGRGLLTGNQRARKPLGKCAVGEELAPRGCEPRAASLASALQSPSEGHMSAGCMGRAGTERWKMKINGFL